GHTWQILSIATAVNAEDMFRPVYLWIISLIVMIVPQQLPLIISTAFRHKINPHKVGPLLVLTPKQSFVVLLKLIKIPMFLWLPVIFWLGELINVRFSGVSIA